ncbi:MAG: hypothetical protein ABIV36_25940 [Sphingobium limneticum]
MTSTKSVISISIASGGGTTFCDRNVINDAVASNATWRISEVAEESRAFTG